MELPSGSCIGKICLQFVDVAGRTLVSTRTLSSGWNTAAEAAAAEAVSREPWPKCQQVRQRIVNRAQLKGRWSGLDGTDLALAGGLQREVPLVHAALASVLPHHAVDGQVRIHLRFKEADNEE